MVKRDPHHGFLLLSLGISFNSVIVEVQIQDLVFNLDLMIELGNRFENQFQHIT